MSHSLSLDGRSVLVVDDDFILAMNTCAALEDAGATVIGPFGQMADAVASLQTSRPDAALVDINLGSGPDFRLARALGESGIPTLMLTGYDKDIIPADLVKVPYLQKPVDDDQLLAAIFHMLS